MHYNFVEKAAMEKDIAEGKFLEHARVHDNIYGTSFAAVDAVSNAGRVCVLDIDVQGAELVKKSDLDAVYVFIAPPSMAELERRLRGRGTEKEEAIKTRLANAGKEMEKTKEDGFFNRVIVNDTIHTSYCSLKAVIAGEVRPRLSRRTLTLHDRRADPKPLTSLRPSILLLLSLQIYGRPWEWDGDAAPSAAYKKRFYEDRVLFWLSDFFSVMKDVVNIACDVGPVLLAGAVGAAAAFRYMDKN